jgi:hypothetical protein
MKLLNKRKFDEAVAELLIDIEEEESKYPQDMVNAYNWGLMHASLLLNGVDTETIREMR